MMLTPITLIPTPIYLNKQSSDVIKKQAEQSPIQVHIDCEIAKISSISTEENSKKYENRVLIPTTILVDPTNNSNKKKEGLRILRKIKKLKKKNPLDYRKNICGYITKKVMRQFTSTQYLNTVMEVCKNYNCDYNQAKLYYANKIERVTGPSHILGLLVPEHHSEILFKKAFRQFFEWFLREQYLRYLLIEGKMCDKKAYIDYKNKVLLSMIQEKNIKFPVKIEDNSFGMEKNSMKFELPKKLIQKSNISITLTQEPFVKKQQN